MNCTVHNIYWWNVHFIKKIQFEEIDFFKKILSKNKLYVQFTEEKSEIETDFQVKTA